MLGTNKDRRGFKPSFPKQEELHLGVLDLRQDGFIVTCGTIPLPFATSAIWERPRCIPISPIII